MSKLRINDIIALGFLTFALFIGAGNIIFPPIVAQQAGEHVWVSALGFLLTGVGLPVITIIALSRTKGSLELLSAPLGRIASLLLTIICYLSVGPLFATPRTATISYEIGMSSYFNHSSNGLWVYSAVFFSIVAIISLYPNKLLDTVGYVLAPLKIISLMVLGITALVIPAGSVAPAVNNYVAHPFSEGFVNGYLTMDTLGAMVFGIVIIQAIYSRGITDTKLVSRYAIYAGLMAGVGLTLVYISLFKLGLGSHDLVANPENGAIILHAFVQHAYGDFGVIFLTVLISLACAVTAIGLTCACAEYFHELSKISYKLIVLLLVILSFLISNLGLTQLIQISGPVLTAIYPPAIVVIILSFLTDRLNHPSQVIVPVTAVALVFGIIDGFKAADLSAMLPLFLQKLPLYEHNLAWLLPSFVILVVMFCIDRAQLTISLARNK